ncbi:MAG: alpha/beta fold hydrolase [Fuerstiella sp.]
MPQGSVVAVHGIQSHSGWYKDSSLAMARSGWDVYFADRRGSGLNGRSRGHADHGLRLLNDLKLLVELAKQEHPNQPVALLGLSWGGKLASAFAATYPHLVQRLVLLYPATDSIVGPNWRQQLMLKLARHHDVRKRLVALPFADPEFFTNVPSFQSQIANDPLALNSVTTGFLNATADLDRIVRHQCANIKMPTLFMLAAADRIVNNRKVKRRLQSWPVSDLSMIEYSNAEHTLEFCSQRIGFFQDLTHWLNRSLPTDAVQVSEASDK